MKRQVKYIHFRTDRCLSLISFILSMLMLMVLFIPTPAYASSTKDKLDSAKKDLSQIEAELENVRSQLSEFKEEEERLSSDLDWLKTRSAEQNQVYQNALEQKNAAYTIMLEDEAAYQQSLQNLSDKQEEYGDRISQMYKWHNKSLFEIMLTSDSLQSFFTTVRFMKIVTDADEQAMDELEAASAEAEAMRQVSEDSYEEMTRLAEEADRVLQKIQNDQAMTQADLDDAAYSLSLYQDKVYGLQEDANQAKLQVDSYQAQYEEELRTTTTTTTTTTKKQNSSGGGGSSNTNPGYSSNGSFAWPLPVSHYLTSYYGWRFGGTDWHRGIDIAAATGSSVLAARAGTVTYAGWLGGYGNLIIVDHGNGISTRYAHLSGYNCSFGQTVSRGQLIGFVGSTGNSTGPHLHFEILINGSPVNPLSYY